MIEKRREGGEWPVSDIPNPTLGGVFLPLSKNKRPQSLGVLLGWCGVGAKGKSHWCLLLPRQKSRKSQEKGERKCKWWELEEKKREKVGWCFGGFFHGLQ